MKELLKKFFSSFNIEFETNELKPKNPQEMYDVKLIKKVLASVNLLFIIFGTIGNFCTFYSFVAKLKNALLSLRTCCTSCTVTKTPSHVAATFLWLMSNFVGNLPSICPNTLSLFYVIKMSS